LDNTQCTVTGLPLNLIKNLLEKVLHATVWQLWKNVLPWNYFNTQRGICTL